MKQQKNYFQFSKSQHLSYLIALQACISDFAYDKHAHEEYALGVTLSGRQDFFANGQFYRSHPDHIIMFNPDQVHDGHSGTHESLSYCMLYINATQVEAILSGIGLKYSSTFQIKTTVLADSNLQGIILKLNYLLKTPQSESLQQECLVYEMIRYVAQLHQLAPSDPTPTKIDRLLYKARDYIQDNYLKKLSLDDISQQANLSKYHFLRLFRQQFSITPHQYALNCRLNRARDALAAGIPLNDIVFFHGFADLSHLNRRFKTMYGLTPKQYQQHILI